ncbi:YTH domain-containing protein 1 [Babesia sp. Xinjiang]|uniref:YTH domain-containing protein 1 n=1 Tax=Babesia sp. Xinjiang TaxID=462227 RepID=UPI000A21C7C2|nr:YTH domain-containing protein 1 [Babesia sp. Xinjiang]ORM41913.1 YTH domain-containing protein 1 [Babesia sp. Xinjiang]
MDVGDYFDKNIEPSQAKLICEFFVLLNHKVSDESDDNTYYVVKSFSDQNVHIALTHDVWATTPKNEVIFDEAFKKGSNVILIFSINGSSRFIGYALMQSRPGEASVEESVFYLGNGKKFKGKQFDISWIRVVDLPFSECSNLNNSCNEGKPVKIARDGQQVDKATGKELCQLFENCFDRDSKQKSTETAAKRPNECVIDETGLHQVGSYPEELEEFRITGVPSPQLLSGGLEIPPVDPTSPHCFPGIAVSIEQSNTKGKQTQSVKVANIVTPMPLEEAELAAEYNPAIAVFPIDLSNMSYDHYISLYNVSNEYWTGLQEELIKEEVED